MDLFSGNYDTETHTRFKNIAQYFQRNNSIVMQLKKCVNVCVIELF